MITKYRAAHGLGKLSPEGKVTKADAGKTLMQNSINFPATSWPISPLLVTKAITDLDNAITAAATNAPGAVSHMHEMERVLVAVFNLLRAYVELTANATTDPKTVIESAGMVAYVSGGASAVNDLTLSAIGGGVVLIEVPRNTGEASFVYQSSTDDVTWQIVEISKLASLRVVGLNPGTVLHFRFAAVAKTLGAYSQSKSIMVV